VETTRFRQLLLIGLGHLAAGMFFGTGCIIVEHVDHVWWPDQDTAQEKTAAEPTGSPHRTATGTKIASHQ
jgi:hypothetical protein